MPLLKPDPTFYPSPRLAAQGPPEKLAYVAALNPPGSKNNDAIIVVDLDPNSSTYCQEVGRCTLPKFGDELHHFGWNACSSALCPYAPHPHIERRYLIVPGIRSSRLYVIDIKPNPREPKIVRTIEPEELIARSGYSRPHTVHCGPEMFRERARIAFGRWSRRNFPARSFHLRRSRKMGGRPGGSIPALRLLVALAP